MRKTNLPPSSSVKEYPDLSSARSQIQFGQLSLTDLEDEIWMKSAARFDPFLLGDKMQRVLVQKLCQLTGTEPFFKRVVSALSKDPWKMSHYLIREVGLNALGEIKKWTWDAFDKAAKDVHSEIPDSESSTTDNYEKSVEELHHQYQRSVDQSKQENNTKEILEASLAFRCGSSFLGQAIAFKNPEAGSQVAVVGNAMASVVEQGTQLFSLARTGASLLSFLNPVMMIGSAILSIFSLFQKRGPTVEVQLLRQLQGQVTAVAQEVNAIHREMHIRFDRMERILAFGFNTILENFGKLEQKIDQIGLIAVQSFEIISFQMAAVRQAVEDATRELAELKLRKLERRVELWKRRPLSDDKLEEKLVDVIGWGVDEAFNPYFVRSVRRDYNFSDLELITECQYNDPVDCIGYFSRFLSQRLDNVSLLMRLPNPAIWERASELVVQLIIGQNSQNDEGKRVIPTGYFVDLLRVGGNILSFSEILQDKTIFERFIKLYKVKVVQLQKLSLQVLKEQINDRSGWLQNETLREIGANFLILQQLSFWALNRSFLQPFSVLHLLVATPLTHTHRLQSLQTLYAIVTQFPDGEQGEYQRIAFFQDWLEAIAMFEDFIETMFCDSSEKQQEEYPQEVLFMLDKLKACGREYSSELVLPDFNSRHVSSSPQITLGNILQDNVWYCVKVGNLVSLKAVTEFDVNQADELGQTLLHHAVKFGQGEVAQWLLDQGVSIDSQDRFFGNTALHLAAESGLIEMMVMLVNAGANTRIANRLDQQTPEDIERQRLAENPERKAFLTLLQPKTIVELTQLFKKYPALKRFSTAPSGEDFRLIKEIQMGSTVPPYSMMRKVVFSSSGIIAVGETNGTIKLWNLENGQLMGDLGQHSGGSIRDLLSLGDGNRIASGGNDTVQIWNTKTRQAVHSIKVNGILVGMKLTDQDMLVCFTKNGSMQVFNTDSFECVQTQTLEINQNEQVESFDVKDDLLAAKVHGRVGLQNHCDLKVWNSRTGESVWTIRESSNIGFGQYKLIPNNRLISAHEGDVRLWDVSIGKQLKQINTSVQGLGQTLSLLDDRYAIYRRAGDLWVWDIEREEHLNQGWHLGKGADSVPDVTFSDSGQLATVVSVPTIRLTGAAEERFHHFAMLWNFPFSSPGARFGEAIQNHSLIEIIADTADHAIVLNFGTYQSESLLNELKALMILVRKYCHNKDMKVVVDEKDMAIRFSGAYARSEEFDAFLKALVKKSDVSINKDNIFDDSDDNSRAEVLNPQRMFGAGSGVASRSDDKAQAAHPLQH